MSFTTEELVSKYVELRDAKDAIAAKAKVDAEPITAAMDTIGSVLLDMMNKSGETSKKTVAGTAFIKLIEFIGVENWDETMKFIDEKNMQHMLKRDVNKTAVLEYMKETGTVPPGLKYSAAREVQVRRPAK